MVKSCIYPIHLVRDDLVQSGKSFNISTSLPITNDMHAIVLTGFPVCFIHKIPGYLQVKKVILQVIVWTILAPKGRNQRYCKIAGVQILEKKCLNIILKCTSISTFQVLSMFSAKFLVLYRFSHILGHILGYFWTWKNKMQICRLVI